jgi:pSer/pThr/pTyr-binding forkhead associated (FHA) protein
MTECPACGRQYRAGTLFCAECGVYLSTGSPLRTDPLPEGDQTATWAYPWTDSAQVDPESEMPTAMSVTIAATERQVVLPVVPETYLGRLDAAHSIFPNLDLTVDGGIETGVSRRHAKIYHLTGRFFIEDLDSANGTFVNGERLVPYLPYPLQSGDELRLGRLVMTLEFDDSSA